MKVNSYTYMYIYRNISTLSPLSLFNINNNNDIYVTIIFIMHIPLRKNIRSRLKLAIRTLLIIRPAESEHYMRQYNLQLKKDNIFYLFLSVRFYRVYQIYDDCACVCVYICNINQFKVT